MGKVPVCSRGKDLIPTEAGIQFWAEILTSTFAGVMLHVVIVNTQISILPYLK